MIKTPYRRAQQHKLFLDLNKDDIEATDFIEATQKIEKDIIISCRDCRDDFGSLTLLHEASRLGKDNAVKHLLSLGHPIDVIDSSVSGRTSLMDAIERNKISTVIILIKGGANISTQDVRGENSMHYAARIGTSMIRAIIENVDLPNDAIQSIMSTTNVKLRFPEDLAMNSVVKDMLLYIRVNGVAPMKNKRAPR